MSTDERDALRTAEKVERYWRTKGYGSVRCEIERVEEVANVPTYRIRCNLVNGLPPDFRAEDAHRLERGT